MGNWEPLILLVEDDINDQTFIKRALRRCGIINRIAVVNDGEEATAYLRGFDKYEDRKVYPLPSLIITDVKMPRMTGIELLTWINDRAEFRLIPTIVLTSSGDESEIAAAFSRGVKGYMIKPTEYSELERLIQIVADYWRASCVPMPRTLRQP